MLKSPNIGTVIPGSSYGNDFSPALLPLQPYSLPPSKLEEATDEIAIFNLVFMRK